MRFSTIVVYGLIGTAFSAGMLVGANLTYSVGLIGGDLTGGTLYRPMPIPADGQTMCSRPAVNPNEDDSFRFFACATSCPDGADFRMLVTGISAPPENTEWLLMTCEARE